MFQYHIASNYYIFLLWGVLTELQVVVACFSAPPKIFSGSATAQVTTRARAGRGASVLLVFYTSFGSDLNRWIKHPINYAQALSLWAILMFLLGSKSSPYGKDSPIIQTAYGSFNLIRIGN